MSYPTVRFQLTVTVKLLLTIDYRLPTSLLPIDFIGQRCKVLAKIGDIAQIDFFDVTRTSISIQRMQMRVEHEEFASR